MTFNDFAGNEKIIGRLQNAITCGNISHAYILEGDRCIDKRLLAECFAKAVLCAEQPGFGCDHCRICNKISHGNHEDLHYVEADGNSIKDEMIEDLQEKLRRKPLGGDRNIAIVQDADTMTLRAQNRLLKTLEEPPAGAVILLLSENTENLAQTILSRCVIYRLHYGGEGDYGDLAEAAQKLADLFLENAPFYKVKAELYPFLDSRESGFRLLDALERIYGALAAGRHEKSRLYRREDIFRAVSSIEETRRSLQRGVAIGYALKKMALEIGG